MKTKFTLILVMLLVLIGCSKGSSREEVLLSKYETAYNELVSNTKFEEQSEYYHLEVLTSKLEDGTYRVDVILDQAQIAMYNIQMIMELDSTGEEQYEEINASLGIVDDSQYNLIPNQVNEDNGFYAGLILSSISKNESGSLKMMITWSNYANTKQFAEFIEVPYSTVEARALKLATEVDEDDLDQDFEEDMRESNSDE